MPYARVGGTSRTRAWRVRGRGARGERRWEWAAGEGEREGLPVGQGTGTGRAAGRDVRAAPQASTDAVLATERAGAGPWEPAWRPVTAGVRAWPPRPRRLPGGCRPPRERGGERERSSAVRRPCRSTSRLPGAHPATWPSGSMPAVGPAVPRERLVPATGSTLPKRTVAVGGRPRWDGHGGGSGPGRPSTRRQVSHGRRRSRFRSLPPLDARHACVIRAEVDDTKDGERGT